MSALVALGVGLGAGLGAQLRYAAERVHGRIVGRRVAQGHGTPKEFPWATLTVNVVGSALLGVVAGLVVRGSLDPAWQAVLGAGLAGGLTTFSTFSFDVVELVREGRPLRAGLDVLLSLVLGLAAAAAAYHLTF